MRILAVLLSILFNSFFLISAFSQEMPLVYDVENTCEDCQTPVFPPIGNLPTITSLPNPFEWSDGRGTISNFSDWKYRRAEIGETIEHYEIGKKPERPENISASYEDGILTVNITVDGNTLTLTSPVNLPEGEGPFPAVIGMGGPTGSLPANIFTDRDIAQIGFNFGQVMSHTQTRGSEPINELYPGLTSMGAYSAWPWGVSRLIDGLELVSEDLNIDLERMAVTGCSFAGKMALYAGAFDERIALTIPQESGGGGYTSWRMNETLNGVERLGNTNASWFSSSFLQFSNAVDKLPFDHHELISMVAPRAILLLGNADMVWLADESGYVSTKAAQEVYDALGISDRIGFATGSGYGHCALPANQVPYVEAYVDKFLLGDESADTDILVSPYDTNLSRWITWETPELADGTSFLETTPLVEPNNAQAELDTSVILKWHQLDGAEEYNVQLSTNNAFNNISGTVTTTDTTLTFNELQKGRYYYWRVQVKNTENILGPWSEAWSFSTAIPMPFKPELISATHHPTRSGYATFNWMKPQNAQTYKVQLAEDENFEVNVKTSSSSDTVKAIYGTDEGINYYWRVRAENISHIGPWSDVLPLTIILSPSNINLEHTRSNVLKLSWKDNSDVEDGYIIERKQNAESSFSVIDTLAADINSYEDLSLDGDLTSYVYRVKTFMGTVESEYSDEISITAVSIDKNSDMPKEFSLSQNYPNPFNPTTSIMFGIPKASNVVLSVYNMLGQKVGTLIEGRLNAGFHTAVFDASQFSSGVYFYTLQADDFIQTKKFSLIK